MSTDPTPAGGSADDVHALAAALRADVADLDTYARVLTTTLADALPDGMVTLERSRSLADRLAGRPGRTTGLRVRLGEATLELEAAPGRPRARVVTEVGGVIISRREVPVADWVQILAEHLTQRARESAAARAALGGLLGT